MNGPGSPFAVLSRRALLSAAVLLLCACALWPAGARAATVAVTTTSDMPGAGQCSLREAVTYADGTAEPSCGPGTATPPTTINLPAGTYALSGSGLSLTAPMTITGAGAAKTTISGGHAVQPIAVAVGAVVTISGVTVSDGVSGVPSTGCTGTGFLRSCPAESGNNGGGITNAGTLTLTDDVITGNTASAGTLPTGLLIACINGNCPARAGEGGGSGGGGGGIYNSGQLDVEHSTISHNASGAGASGTAGVSGTGTDVSEGKSGGYGGYGGYGGGIYNGFQATLTVNQSTIAANRTGPGGNGGAGSSATDAMGAGGYAGSAGGGGRGGGIMTFGALTLTNSTVTANTTGAGGNGANGGAGSGGGQDGKSSYGGYGGFGGGVATGATIRLTNDTLTANTAGAGGTGGTLAGPGGGGAGGAIFVDQGVTQLSFVTIADNTATGSGGALEVLGSALVQNSIVASNRGTPALNCAGLITDNGHNLVSGDSSCPGTNANPRLGPLLDNGGPTQTLAIGAGSGAIGLVPGNDCPVDTDQRGVIRPQGTRCDAGAYELAPPSLTAPAASAGQTGATITAAIIPNLQPTKAVVRYGRTTSYGSSTPAQTIGSGNGPVAFRATLSGLRRLRTYHAQIVATNADGTTTSSDLTFTTGLSAAIVSASTKGAALRLRITCRGGAAGRCAGPVTVTSRVTRRAGKPVAVSARAVRPRTTRTVTTLAHGRYALGAGTTRTIRLTLNRTGRGLLKRFHRFAATVTVSGARPPRKRVMFGSARRRRHR